MPFNNDVVILRRAVTDQTGTLTPSDEHFCTILKNGGDTDIKIWMAGDGSTNYWVLAVGDAPVKIKNIGGKDIKYATASGTSSLEIICTG